MKHSNFLFALAAALCATPGFAASSASASIGPLTLQLIDLDLGDGVTPSITFVGAASILSAGVSRSGLGNSEQKPGVTAFTPESVSAAVVGAQATASTAGNGSADSSSFAASGSASDFIGNPGESASYVAGVLTPEVGFNIAYFVLTPQTQLVMSALATISAQGTGASGNPAPFGDYASAVAAITIQIAGSDTLEYINNSDGSTGFNFSDSRTLSVTVSNMSATDLQVNYSIIAQVQGATVTTAVPEPAAAATLFAGLAGLAILTRRRRH